MKIIYKLGQDDGNIESIICNPITVSGVGKTKLLKGLENLIKNPKAFFDIGKQNMNFTLICTMDLEIYSYKSFRGY